MPYQGAVSGPVMAAASRDGRADVNPGFAGQGMGMIQAVRPAKDIFMDIVASAEATFEKSKSYMI
jgi:nitronate monooxygenase